MKNIFMYIRTQSSATHCENAYEKITPLRTKGELQNAIKGDQKGERQIHNQSTDTFLVL